MTAKPPRRRVPTGLIVSLVTLALVFFMILGVCYRG